MGAAEVVLTRTVDGDWAATNTAKANIGQI